MRMPKLSSAMATACHNCSMRTTGIALFASLCLSCSDSSPSPTPGITSISPPTSPFVVTVAITMPQVLMVGDSVQATAMAILSDGQGRLVESGWRSDATGVASVTDTDRVKNVAYGLANISVTANGAHGTKTLRVDPNYHRQWNGSYRIDECTPFPSQVYAQFCVGYTPGTVLPLSIAFSQKFGHLRTKRRRCRRDQSHEQHVSVRLRVWRFSMPTSGRMIGTVSLIRSGNAGAFVGANVEGTVVSLVR
jgi:hypothetical protein